MRLSTRPCVFLKSKAVSASCEVDALPIAKLWSVSGTVSKLVADVKKKKRMSGRSATLRGRCWISEVPEEQFVEYEGLRPELPPPPGDFLSG